MGSPFTIIIAGSDSMQAAILAKSCFELVDSFNHIFSDYDTSSELSRLNRSAGTGVPQKVSPALWHLLRLSRNAWLQSRGAFDISVGPLSAVWRKARKEKRFPAEKEISGAKQLTGFRNILLDTLNSTALLAKRDMRLDLGGIAKGYIAQQVIGFLARNGMRQALADAGGDIAMSNAPTGTAGWTIGVNIPETTETLLPQKLQLQNKAVATSGDAFQYIEHNGRKFSHIIDPRKGYGITTQRNVTVIAGDGASADWLATACSILPIEAAKQLCKSLSAELLITEINNGRVAAHMTGGFKRYWKKMNR